LIKHSGQPAASQTSGFVESAEVDCVAITAEAGFCSCDAFASELFGAEMVVTGVVSELLLETRKIVPINKNAPTIHHFVDSRSMAVLLKFMIDSSDKYSKKRLCGETLRKRTSRYALA
jgi:hypothetical protein